MFKVPPYLPRWTQLCGTTYGLSGSRLSTAGSLPPFTCAAINGDSVKLFGGVNGFFAEPLAVAVPGELLPLSEPFPVLFLPLPLPLLQALSTAEPAANADPYRNVRRGMPCTLSTVPWPLPWESRALRRAVWCVTVNPLAAGWLGIYENDVSLLPESAVDGHAAPPVQSPKATYLDG